jgi:hypothetical protein
VPDHDELRTALAQVLAGGENELMPWLELPPQTNEPMRSGPLMAGLLVVAAETGGLPFALYEVGASAGLILALDRYRHRLGSVEAGDPASPVFIEPEWEGALPPVAEVRVASRRGTDLEPVDLTRTEDRDRLLAYVWPDQADRVARVEAAIEIAARGPAPIDAADAADWTERTIQVEPEKGAIRVLMHAVALQYAPDETRERVAAHAARVGAGATADAPFAWLRFEADPEYGEKGSLRLTLWPGGTERVLALGDTHAERLHWLCTKPAA